MLALRVALAPARAGVHGSRQRPSPFNGQQNAMPCPAPPRQPDQHLAQLGCPGDPLREIQPQRGGAGLQVDAVRVAAGAAPVGRPGTQKLRRIEVHGLAMVGVHVLNGALLGLQQALGVGHIGQELLRREVDNPAEAGHQMRAGRPDSKKRKILKIYKDFRRWMGVEVAPAQQRQLIARGLLGAARQHDPRALQRVALGPLVQHQRDPGIAENILRVQRQPRDQQDRRAVGMAGEVDQRAIGIARSSHQSRQSPCRLRRSSDRVSLAGSKSVVGCIGHLQTSHCNTGLFPAKRVSI